MYVVQCPYSYTGDEEGRGLGGGAVGGPRPSVTGVSGRGGARRRTLARRADTATLIDARHNVTRTKEWPVLQGQAGRGWPAKDLPPGIRGTVPIRRPFETMPRTLTTMPCRR